MTTALRTILLTVVLSTLAWASPSAARAGGPQNGPTKRPPNIIVILADDLGYGDLGVYGGKDIPTPNLDALARAGVRFTDGYVTCPICAPTRAGLMSGRYQQRFGFEHNPGPEQQASPRFGLPRSERTLAEKLKDAGYATGMFGKWHLGYKEELQPHQRGFDEFFGFLSGAHTYMPGESRQRRGGGGGGYNEGIIRNGKPVEEKEYLTEAFAREAVAFISAHAKPGAHGKAAPFFVYLPFNAVHGPMEATRKYTDRFAHISDANRRTFAGMLTALDEAVGRVLAAVKESGQEDNTLVFFFSDNGGPTPQTTASNGPLNGYKTQVLEGGIRVPFLMKWPGGGVPAGKVYQQPVMSLDVHATVLAAAGFDLNAPVSREKTDKPPPGELEGRDLLPFVTAEGERGKVGPHEAIFWRMGNQWAVRKGDWKLLSQARANARQPGEVRLYNLREDIGEKNDLAAKMPEKVAELRAAYDAWNAGNIDALWRRSEGRDGDGGGGAGDNDGANPAPGNRQRRGVGGAGRIRESFDRLDTNKDGFLTAEEYNADAAISARRPFAEIDTNKDGKLSYEEVAAAFGGAGQRRQRGGN
jgi:arylsulfatase A-like enzyme